MKASKLLHTRRRIDRFHAGLVHEIAGPAYSGKSQLCYQEIITFLHHQPGLAVIIDTNGTFSPSTFSALIKERDGSDQMAERVVLVPCLDIYGVVEVVQGLQGNFVSNMADEDKVGIVLIDNITNPVSLLMQNGRSQGHDLMVCLVRDLTLLSRLHNICILIVNTTVKLNARRNGKNGEDGSSNVSTTNMDSAFADVAIKPALGTTWPHLIDYCLFIHPVPEGTRKIPGKRGLIQEVVRSRIGGVGEWEMV